MITKIFSAKTALPCFVALVVVLLLLPGCGDGRPKRVKVSGTVLIDDKPLPGGFIRFYTEGGRSASSNIDEHGRFTLSSYEEGDGVVPGQHPISVSGAKRLSETKVRWNAPPKYANPKTSGLQETIEGPTDSLTINLSWKGTPNNGPFEAQTELVEE